MSIGMERRWQAKMVFMRGMYCAVGGEERERRRIREVSGEDWPEEEERLGSGDLEREEGPPAMVLERRVVCLLM